MKSSLIFNTIGMTSIVFSGKLLKEPIPIIYLTKIRDIFIKPGYSLLTQICANQIKLYFFANIHQND